MTSWSIFRSIVFHFKDCGYLNLLICLSIIIFSSYVLNAVIEELFDWFLWKLKCSYNRRFSCSEYIFRQYQIAQLEIMTHFMNIQLLQSISEAFQKGKKAHFPYNWCVMCVLSVLFWLLPCTVSTLVRFILFPITMCLDSPHCALSLDVRQ